MVVLARFLPAAGVAMGVTLVLGPLSIILARLFSRIDVPGLRHNDDKHIPRLGGLALFGGFLAGLVFLPGGNLRWGFITAGTVAFLVGFLDDVLDLRPGWKLTGQVAAAIILPLFGISIKYLSNPWGGMFSLGWLAVPLTVFWVVALMNMINLIDGMDGLAAGVSAIAAASLLFLPQCVQRPFVAALCLLTIGCTLGFLPYNFHPARTFMGDGGAHFLGFTLGFITVAGALKGQAALTLSVPVLALAVPFFDTAYAIVRRWYKRQPIYLGDKEHLHHRLIFNGFNQRQTVLLLYLCSAVFGVGSNLLARLAPVHGAITLLGLVACAAGGIVWLNRANASGDKDRALPG